MVRDFKELVGHSAESELLRYTFSNGRLHVSLRMPDVDDRIVDIVVNTQIVIANVPKLGGSLHRTCFIELVRLVDELTTNQQGLYVPSVNHGSMLAEIRGGLGLAYGKHVSDAAFVLRFRGSLLVACTVAQLQDLEFSIRGVS